MRKKFFTLLMIGVLSISLIACGEKPDSGKKEETSSKEEVSDSEKEEEKGSDSKNGIIKEEGLKEEPVMSNEELNISGETGPFNYTVESVYVEKIAATSQSMADMLGINKDEEKALVAINISAENTSDSDMSFYIGQAVLTTNTKEQLEVDQMIGNYIDGEFLGNVKHSGTLVYILKESLAEDVTSLTLHIEAPNDENLEPVGDEVKIDIPISQ